MSSRFQKLKMPPCKIRKIVDGIEAACAAISRIGVAGSVERGNAIADPIAVVGKLDGGHLRVHGDGTTRDWIERVFAHGLIKSVREIDAANVAAAKPAEIADANTVRERTASGSLIDDAADGRGAHKKSVVVVMHARVILIPRADKFRGVAGKEKILNDTTFATTTCW